MRPEKIYLNPLLMEDGESIVRRCTFERQRDSQIEYTQTDAFIEKAVKYLKDNVTYIHPRSGTKECIVNISKFIDYMKGE